ncbi:MAG: ABC transporter ATP-binding protein [Hyphomicrobiaceae bacterium]|nr:ABC transporter ATP-binding protein [Hyphomicrobiaceae bacterium]
MSVPIIEVAGLTRRFGGVPAVTEVSFTCARQEILGIIGPNGAGKTTLFNLITGSIPATAGQIHFDGRDITGSSPDQVARLGMIRTFQAATIFRHETVRENLRRGALFGHIGRPSWLLRGSVREASRAARERAEELIDFLGLVDCAEQEGGNLPYGRQKILGLGIALAARPKQLLMDEPAAGLNPAETREMGELIERIRAEFGIGVVLVEHDVAMVCRTCSRIIVLNYGKLIANASPDEIRSNPEVIEAYLGGDVEDA